jgi:hypothetical protein
MKPMIIMPTRRAPLIAQVLAFLTLTGLATASFSQSHLSPPAGDDWQLLGGAVPAESAASTAPAAALTASLATVSPSAAARSIAAPALIAPAPVSTAIASTAVTPVVLPGADASAMPTSLALAITPQDINLRNALDRWLQQQGWQLAWKIDDDLPLEFNATFSGDFDSVLTQVMRATNHMRTPTRICEHTNNVIRVVARAANCQD